jgi:hypothetical protein
MLNAIAAKVRTKVIHRDEQHIHPRLRQEAEPRAKGKVKQQTSHGWAMRTD